MEFTSFIREGKDAEEYRETPPVEDLLKRMVAAGKFSVGAIRREVSKAIYRSTCQSDPQSDNEAVRPDGLDPQEMVSRHPEVFGHGAELLPEGSCNLRPKAMAQHHCKICSRCKWSRTETECRVNKECYFYKMLMCIEYGWRPPLSSTTFEPLYHVDGNYSSTADYAEGVDEELKAMLSSGAIVACEDEEGQVEHPLGAVIKMSDKTRARALLSLVVDGQKSLQVINQRFKTLGLPKVKIRVTMDCTATGVNLAAGVARFTYPGVRQGVAIVRPGAYLGVCDVSRYFHSFPWALDMRRLMRIRWRNQQYECWGLSFGFALCPYYCSAWSAEFRRWVLAELGPCAHMVDDWLLVASGAEEIRDKCAALAALFASCGFGMAVEKCKYGTSVKYLGVVIDTAAMRLRIDKDQALGTRLLLQDAARRIQAKQRVGHTTLYHLAGKLNWFAEVIQSGRLHTHSFWDYLRATDELKVPRRTRDRILHDISWWIGTLVSWEAEDTSGLEYRILSAEVLQQDPEALYVVQSDASGSDGMGYHHGYASPGATRRYGSAQWGAEGVPTSSHAMELRALRVCLEREALPRHGLVLLWLTDSASAAMSVNKGNCANTEGLAELERILAVCDQRGYEILAAWIPREDNVLADYLSHLSALLAMDRVEGEVGVLAAEARAGRSHGGRHRLGPPRGGDGHSL